MNECEWIGKKKRIKKGLHAWEVTMESEAKATAVRGAEAEKAKAAVETERLKIEADQGEIWHASPCQISPWSAQGRGVGLWPQNFDNLEYHWVKW